MRPRSLRLRLIVAAVITTISSLVVSGLSLSWVFERFAIERISRELDAHLSQLIGALKFDVGAGLTLENDLADPRFDEPRKGYYWQIDDNGRPVLRSRSLWDKRLDVRRLPQSHIGVFSAELPGVDSNQVIYARGRNVRLPTDLGDKNFRLVVGIDRKEISKAHSDFATTLAVSLAILGLVLIGAAWLQISVGLRPLDKLHQKLEDIQSGTAKRLMGNFPSEVERLTAKLNELLEVQERSIEKAKARTGDLAHGLKTPLAILFAEARSLRRRGESASAHEVDTQVAAMRRSVERELARWRDRRTNAGGPPLTIVFDAVETLVGTLRKIPGTDHIKWLVEVEGVETALIDPDDFNDVFGNLFDNARKWATTAVTISTRASRDKGLKIIVKDDGPGVSDASLENIVRRGARSNSSRAGSGLGLAIVQDILEVYGGELHLNNGHYGGFVVSVHIPARLAIDRSSCGDR